MQGAIETTRESIKAALLRYNAYTRYFEKISVACMLSNVNTVPATKGTLISKQQELVQTINDLEYKMKEIFNTTRDVKKMEVMHDSIAKRRQELLVITSELGKMDPGGEAAGPACDDEVSAIKSDLAAEYQALMRFLLDARKDVPALYMQLERETGVHLFPQTSLSKA